MVWGHSQVLASPGEPHEGVNIPDAHAAALLQINDLVSPQLAQDPADGFNGERKKIAYVGAGHRKDNYPRVLPPARIAAREFYEEGSDPFRCRALPDGEQEIMGARQLLCEQLPERYSKRRILARGALNAPPWQAPQAGQPSGLGIKFVSAGRPKAEHVAWVSEAEDLPSAVGQHFVEADGAGLYAVEVGSLVALCKDVLFCLDAADGRAGDALVETLGFLGVNLPGPRYEL